MKNQKKRKIAALALGSFLLMSVAGV